MQQAVDYLTKCEPIFAEIVNQYGIPEIPWRPQGFQTLVLLILEQQVSIDSARATFLKIKAAVSHFQPEILIAISDEEFRNFGVSRQKTSYIKALSTAILAGELNIENLATQSPESVREQLIKIKGIGHWTIDVYLVFCLQAPDIIPLGDIAVVNTIKELFDIHDKEGMLNRVATWSPYRSVATFLLWHYYLKKRNRTIQYIKVSTIPQSK